MVSLGGRWTSLNQHAVRETHHTQSPFHQAWSVPPRTLKTVFDAWNGYHSVSLKEEDQHLTTFITPWGRYKYRTATKGYIASGDGYSRRFDENRIRLPQQDQVHRRHTTVVRQPGRQFLSGMQMARHMWTEWNHHEPR